MNLSLCMIVRDEETNLKQCLDAACKYVNEIIIVDTGSEDKTKIIASEFTDKVYDFKWCNDFSSARNFSIEKASNDWVLILDADEKVMEFDSEYIHNFMESDMIVGRITRISLFQDNTGVKRYKEKINRLYNRKYFHYEGTIHEQVVSNTRSLYEAQPVNIIIEHSGYTEKEVGRTGKILRNIELLKQSIYQNDNDPYLYYQLGKSYYMAGEYIKARDSFNAAFKIGVDCKYAYVEDMIETYGYSLVNCGEYDKALQLESYSKFYGDLPDYNFIMGLIYMNNGKFSQAVEKFMDCICEDECKIEGVNSYLAYYNIGVIFECLGFNKQAADYYRQCGGYEPSIKRLKQLTHIC